MALKEGQPRELKKGILQTVPFVIMGGPAMFVKFVHYFTEFHLISTVCLEISYLQDSYKLN